MQVGIDPSSNQTIKYVSLSQEKWEDFLENKFGIVKKFTGKTNLALSTNTSGQIAPTSNIGVSTPACGRRYFTKSVRSQR